MPLQPNTFRITHPHQWRCFACAAIALLLATHVRAQTPYRVKAGSPAALFIQRLNRDINSMVAGQDSENVHFNARVAAMNAAAPLDPRHLDSASVAANVSRVIEFTTYLKQERHWSDSLTQSFEDSMFILSAERQPDLKVLDAANDQASFTIERTAFNTFLGAMSKVYSDVLDVLLFLQHAHYTVVKKNLTFHSRDELAQYKKLIGFVNADSKTLNIDNKKLQIANAKANAMTGKKSAVGTL